jgi:hypothetical protein
MSLRIRFQYSTASSLGYSVERLSDGLLWDFVGAGVGSGQTFTATPAVSVADLPEDTGIFVGRYTTTLASTPAAQFTDGDYCITIHNTASAFAVVGELVATMHNGDDATVFPGAGSGSDPWSTLLPGSYPAGSAGAKLANLAVAADPWATPLPGSYPAGSAGAIVANNLDAKVSTRLAASSYVIPDNANISTILSTITTNLDAKVSGLLVSNNGNYAALNGIIALNLDAKISSRSVYAGGPVSSVAAPVTVGTNNDKIGYALALNGLDAISIETGVNLRQGFSSILAVCAGTISGAGTGTVVVKGANVTATRLIVVGDTAGNRTAVTLAFPT